MLSYTHRLILPFSTITSVVGFALLIGALSQIISGFYLAWYYLPEPGLVTELREEMFNDTRFGLEIFSSHVRGVDLLFSLTYLHIFKKIYAKNHLTFDADGWVLGGYAFLWFHYIVVLGITLSGSHLSDLTLTIVANIYWSLFGNTHKSYYFFFTNKHLNTDQLARLAIFHYLTPWYYLYLIQLHILFCHESWDSDSGVSSQENKTGSYLSWFFDALLKELQDAGILYTAFFLYFSVHHINPFTVNYFFFERWNVSELDEIRFYGVAPHWYFRPLMGLLVVSPTHYEGLLWVVCFFTLLATLPAISGFFAKTDETTPALPTQTSLLQNSTFIVFLLAILYTASVLPCGRYYYEPEGGYCGNVWFKISYQYTYLYFCWLLHHFDLVDFYSYKFYKELLKIWELVCFFLLKKVKAPNALPDEPFDETETLAQVERPEPGASSDTYNAEGDGYGCFLCRVYITTVAAYYSAKIKIQTTVEKAIRELQNYLNKNFYNTPLRQKLTRFFIFRKKPSNRQSKTPAPNNNKPTHRLR